MGKLGLGKVKQIAQGHTVKECQTELGPIPRSSDSKVNSKLIHTPWISHSNCSGPREKTFLPLKRRLHSISFSAHQLLARLSGERDRALVTQVSELQCNLCPHSAGTRPGAGVVEGIAEEGERQGPCPKERVSGTQTHNSAAGRMQ